MESKLYSPDVLALFQDIRISTGNGKTGPSFSLLEGTTCPGKTDICWSLCYTKTGRMNLPVARNARARNTKAVIQVLKQGSDTLAYALCAAIKRSDSKTIRIHDSGDFFSPSYIQAWIKVAELLPNVKFWAYTRSWRIAALVPHLKQLAALPNVALWISADIESWIPATIEGRDETWAGVAFMETEGAQDFAGILQKTFGKRFMNFPVHGHFGRVKVAIQETIKNCPAITKQIPHDKANPACLACKFCLPA